MAVGSSVASVAGSSLCWVDPPQAASATSSKATAPAVRNRWGKYFINISSFLFGYWIDKIQADILPQIQCLSKKIFSKQKIPIANWELGFVNHTLPNCQQR
jgi:hypothetical protein